MEQIKAWAIVEKKTSKLVYIEFCKLDWRKDGGGIYAYCGFDGKNYPTKNLKQIPCECTVAYKVPAQ